MVKQLKVYGTVAGEKRFKRKGHYYSVKRDKTGKFRAMRKWTPKKPNVKQRYIEKYVSAPKGEDIREKVKKSIEEEVWVEYEGTKYENA